MKYKCRACDKEFDILAYVDGAENITISHLVFEEEK